MSSDSGKVYLSTKVTPIFEKLVVELVKRQPESVVDYMIQWLKTNKTTLEGHHDANKSDSDQDSDEGEDDLVDHVELVK